MTSDLRSGMQGEMGYKFNGKFYDLNRASPSVIKEEIIPGFMEVYGKLDIPNGPKRDTIQTQLVSFSARKFPKEDLSSRFERLSAFNTFFVAMEHLSNYDQWRNHPKAADALQKALKGKSIKAKLRESFEKIESHLLNLVETYKQQKLKNETRVSSPHHTKIAPKTRKELDSVKSNIFPIGEEDEPESPEKGPSHDKTINGEFKPPKETEYAKFDPMYGALPELSDSEES